MVSANPPTAVDTDPADSVQSHHLQCHHQGFGSVVSFSLCPQECWNLVLVQETGDSTICPLHHPSPSLEI